MTNFQQALDLDRVINFGESMYFFQELTNQVDAFSVPSSSGPKEGYGNGWTSEYVGQALNGQLKRGDYYYEMDPSLRFSTTTGQGAGKESVINMNYFGLKIGNDPRYNNIPYAKMYNQRLMNEWLTPREQIDNPSSNHKYWERRYPFVTMNVNENGGQPGYWRGWNSADKPGNPQGYDKDFSNVRGAGSYKKEKFALHYEPYDLNTYSLKSAYHDTRQGYYPQLVIYNKQRAVVSPRLQAFGEAVVATQGSPLISATIVSEHKYVVGDLKDLEYTTTIEQSVTTAVTQTAGLSEANKTSSFANHRYNLSRELSVGRAAPATGGIEVGGKISDEHEQAWGSAIEQLRELSSSQSKEDTKDHKVATTIKTAPNVKADWLGRYTVILDGKTVPVKKGDVVKYTVVARNSSSRFTMYQPVRISEETKIDQNISPAVSMFWRNDNLSTNNVTQKGYSIQLEDFGRKASRPIDFYRKHNGLTMDNIDEAFDVNGNRRVPILEFDNNSGEWVSAAVYDADVKLTAFDYETKVTEVIKAPKNTRNSSSGELINLSDIDTNDEIGASFEGTKNRDVIHASLEGGDIIVLGKGNDKLINPVDSIVFTGTGQDNVKLNGRSHSNTIDTGSGSDKVVVKGASNSIIAGPGTDAVIDKGIATAIDIGGDSARDAIVLGGVESAVYGFDPGEDILTHLHNKRLSVNLYGNGFIDIHDKVTGLKLANVTLDPAGRYDVMSRDSILVSLVAGGAKTSDSARMIEDYFNFSINNDRFAEKFVELGGLSRHFKDYKEIGRDLLRASRSQQSLMRLNTSVHEGLLDAGIKLEDEIIANKLVEITKDIRQSGTTSVDDASAYAAQGFVELIHSTLPPQSLA